MALAAHERLGHQDVLGPPGSGGLDPQGDFVTAVLDWTLSGEHNRPTGEAQT